MIFIKPSARSGNKGGRPILLFFLQGLRGIQIVMSALVIYNVLSSVKYSISIAPLSEFIVDNLYIPRVIFN